MCIKDEKITYSAGALKRKGRSDVTWFEIYGPVTPAENNCGRDAAWLLKCVIPSRTFPHSGQSNGLSIEMAKLDVFNVLPRRTWPTEAK